MRFFLFITSLSISLAVATPLVSSQDSSVLVAIRDECVNKPPARCPQVKPY